MLTVQGDASPEGYIAGEQVLPISQQRRELAMAINNCLNWKETSEPAVQRLPVDALVKKYFKTFEIEIE